MSKKFFESKKSELIHLLGDVFAEHMPPMLKIYAELARRADAVTHRFTCSIDSLAEYLGYSQDDLEAVLIDLMYLRMIDIKVGYKDSTKRTITLRVY